MLRLILEIREGLWDGFKGVVMHSYEQLWTVYIEVIPWRMTLTERIKENLGICDACARIEAGGGGRHGSLLLRSIEPHPIARLGFLTYYMDTKLHRILSHYSLKVISHQMVHFMTKIYKKGHLKIK